MNRDELEAKYPEIKSNRLSVEYSIQRTREMREFDQEVQRELDTGIVGAIKAGKADMVNRPPHYTFGKYEVLDVLMDWFSTEPLLWQVVKYVARAKHKGNYEEDLRKAKFYLERAIAINEQNRGIEKKATVNTQLYPSNCPRDIEDRD